MTMIFHHKIKKGILLSLVVMLTNNLQASSAPEVKTDYTFTALDYTGIALVGATALRFFTREGDNSPARYDWDKIAAGQDLPSQCLYLLDDGLIGHTGSKPYDEVNKDNGRVERIPSHYPKGVGGWTAYYYKSVLAGLGATWVMVTAARIAALSDTTPQNFIPRLTTEITVQIKALGMNPALEVFIPTFAAITGYKLANASNK